MTEHTWDPLILCSCGVSIHDNSEARAAHQNYWHTDWNPARYETNDGFECDIDCTCLYCIPGA